MLGGDEENDTVAERGSNVRTIRLTDRDVGDARRLLALIAGDNDSNASDQACAGEKHSVPRAGLLERAREIYGFRRLRVRHFGKAMFAEAAWEMLLLLYIGEKGSRETVSRLAAVSGFSKSTALRWLDYLENRQMIRREQHPTDKRSVFVMLSDKGRSALELYLSDTLDSVG